MAMERAWHRSPARALAVGHLIQGAAHTREPKYVHHDGGYVVREWRGVRSSLLQEQIKGRRALAFQPVVEPGAVNRRM
jgi:hypothetical protein